MPDLPPQMDLLLKTPLHGLSTLAHIAPSAQAQKEHLGGALPEPSGLPEVPLGLSLPALHASPRQSCPPGTTLLGERQEGKGGTTGRVAEPSCSMRA